MRMIDGKPEYKNGLVRNQSLGLGLQDWMLGGREKAGSWVRGRGPQRPGPSLSALPAFLSRMCW